ncbi:phosphonate metabolism transcriptional regulator PhnF [Paroceanicella profunda]|uniref:Phosphonate metabolism transcriptional regulator PhnF n=2 Tax=Paroceanicella profunda TaxID=2579971 RepID=A0A5B8G452_9RHOB|nr:phosphonate metabolism transcriptional regulator PhnF [Paroceanicella profunda]
MVNGGPPGGGRQAIWEQIREALREDIASGRYAPGAKLPTEAALSDRFGVNRHTARRAVAALQEAGLIHVRRGAGAFVATAPVDYRLGTRTRFAQNLTDAGQTPAREITRLETLAVTAREAAHLEIAPGAPAHVYEGTGLADGQPLTCGHSLFPAERLPELPRHLRESRSVTEALRRCGVADYTRKWTRLTAERATGIVARTLRLPEGAPVLCALSLNIGADRAPVELGRTWFNADLVQLVVDEKSFPGA